MGEVFSAYWVYMCHFIDETGDGFVRNFKTVSMGPTILLINSFMTLYDDEV